MRTRDASTQPAGAEPGGSTPGGTTPGGSTGVSDASQLRRLRQELERAWVRWSETPDVHAPGRDAGRRRPGARRPKAGGAALRTEIVESWARSGEGLDRACAEAPVTDADAARSRWADSQLRRPIGAVADELRRITEDAGFVAAVTDETGTILWTCGGPLMRHAAERINFAPGGRWDEQAMGTNALSLALLRGQAATVFSAEHYLSALHGWVCYCAPIRHPDGRVLGVLDLSTTWDRSHPLALSTVRLLAAGIEERLREESSATRPGRPSPSGRRPGPRSSRAQLSAQAGVRAGVQSGVQSGVQPGADAELALTVLGEGPRLARDEAEIALRPRQLEILTLLALEPDGFTPERLRDAVYGERAVSGSTFKAEVSHLRSALGGGIATRRYALTRPLSCDAGRVAAAVEQGDAVAAVAAYTGPLLPRSEAPGVVAWRDHLHVAVREAVLASGDVSLALAFGQHARYDIALHRHTLGLLPTDDARRGLATARLRAALD